jgi:hypothetical protein
MIRSIIHSMIRRASVRTLSIALLVSATTTPLISQQTPLGLAMQRTGSGTAWQPDATPMHAAHNSVGAWDLMLHGTASIQYDYQGSRRGDRQFGSVNWGMISASHALADGLLTLRGMVSAEPFTVGARGYPLLLQSGEAYRGVPLHDRQHPHDLFMELAGVYDRAVGKNLALSLYVAPVGEPAVGPVAFPHRASASNNPMAPLGHHWQDATHISFGVITAGLYTRKLKIESSIFNGREPDDIRTNFDYRGRSLDSYAARLTVNPDEHWSLSGSYAYLKSPEQLSPMDPVHRVVGSAMYSRAFRSTGDWSSTLVYGANKHGGTARLSSSALVETNLNIDNRNAVFGRAEMVQKSAADLVIESDLVFTGNAPSISFQQPRSLAEGDEATFSVGELSLGYMRELTRPGAGSIGIGVSGTVNLMPATLKHVYGSQNPLGGAIFLRIRPGLMNMHSATKEATPMHDMHKMGGTAGTHATGTAEGGTR